MRDPLRLPLDLLKTLGISIWTFVWITVALVVRTITRSTKIPLAMARSPWASGVLRITGHRVRVEGADEIDWSRPYVVAANHQSFLDVPVLFQALPVRLHFVVKKEIEKIPVLSWYIAAMGMIFVDRKDPAAARESVRATTAVAQGGGTVVLFPEGTRSRDGRIQPLKSGMLAAAAESSVPVLPVAIHGTRESMPPGWVPRYRPRNLRVRIGRPLATDGYKPSDRRSLAASVQTRLEELHQELVGRDGG